MAPERDQQPAGAHAPATRLADLGALIAELGEGSVDAGEVAHAIAVAVASTYRDAVEDDPTLRVDVDLGTGAIRLFRRAEGAAATRDRPSTGTGSIDGFEPVTEPVAEPVGEPVEEEIDLPGGDIARQAASAARRAVAERLRSAAGERVLREASHRRGELIDTLVERPQGRVWLLRAGRDWALLPPEEQIEGEKVVLHQHLKVVVVEGRRRGQDAVMVVSRSHPQLVRLLLEREVPELARGDIVIQAIAREAGRRCKVAVHAPGGEIDPQGACIGPRGVRHRAVTGELGEEQVQIVTWDSDPSIYVAGALAPAAVLEVELDEETRTAHVRVPADQLSLAIGRGGENARLAARLTGWRIDIAGDATVITRPQPAG